MNGIFLWPNLPFLTLAHTVSDFHYAQRDPFGSGRRLHEKLLLAENV